MQFVQGQISQRQKCRNLNPDLTQNLCILNTFFCSFYPSVFLFSLRGGARRISNWLLTTFINLHWIRLSSPQDQTVNRADRAQRLQRCGRNLGLLAREGLGRDRSPILHPCQPRHNLLPYFPCAKKHNTAQSSHPNKAQVIQSPRSALSNSGGH